MAKLYKQIKTQTDNFGSAGAQIRIGEIVKIDPQMSQNGYVNNVKVSFLLNSDAGATGPVPGGFMAYLSTSDTWSDSNVVSAKAGRFAETVNLSAKHTIRQGSGNVTGNMGPLYLYIELTDFGIINVEGRVVVETWGRFVKFDFS